MDAAVEAGAELRIGTAEGKVFGEWRQDLGSKVWGFGVQS